MTDAAGSFLFRELPPGEWMFVASTGTRRGYSARVVVFDDAATAITIEITEPPAGREGRQRKRRGRVPAQVKITGWVRRSATDLPVKNATVIIADGPAPAPDIAAVTDDDGAFSFHGLTPGTWLVRALAPDGERSEAWVDASTGDAEVTLDLADG